MNGHFLIAHSELEKIVIEGSVRLILHVIKFVGARRPDSVAMECIKVSPGIFITYSWAFFIFGQTTPLKITIFNLCQI